MYIDFYDLINSDKEHVYLLKMIFFQNHCNDKDWGSNILSRARAKPLGLRGQQQITIQLLELMMQKSRAVIFFPLNVRGSSI